MEVALIAFGGGGSNKSEVVVVLQHFGRLMWE
jgi:hypothetical protein